MVGFKGLKAYERSYAASIEMYRMANELPSEERFGLTSQIKRAATSIPLNIAEGYGKKESKAEYRRYLLMACGSVNEMLVLLDMCRDLGYLGEDRHAAYEAQYAEIGRMIGGIIKQQQPPEF